MKMKKYILGILLAVVCLSLITPSVAFAKCRWNNNKMVEQGTYACKRTGRSAFGRVVKCTGAGWVLQRGWSICDAEIHRPPTTLNEPVANPIPNTTQYNFAPYPFLPTGTYGTGQAVLPVNDPVTIGNKNLSNYVQNSQGTYTTFNNPVEINLDSTVSAPINFGTGVSGSIDWPPTSIFSNLGFWNKPFAYTFQKYVNDSTVGKWYLLNFFSVPDPTKNIPSIPVKIEWAVPTVTNPITKVTTPVPGVVKYQFKLTSLGGLPGTDDNLPTPIDIPITNPRISPSFSGRAMTTYSWSATPLDASGVEVIGDAVMSGGGPIWVRYDNCGNYVVLPPYGYRLYITDEFILNCNSNQIQKDSLVWNTIPGAVRYEIEYAFKPIPNGVPFKDGAVFSSGTSSNNIAYTIPNGINISPGVTTCTNCGNLTSNPNTAGSVFQYYFGTNLPDFTLNNNAGTYWRVRGIDVDNKVILQNLVQKGIVMPPAPITPYQSAHLTWTKVSGATSYIVDIAKNVSDFAKLPYLRSSEIPITKFTSTVIRGGMGGTTTTPPPLTNAEMDALQDPRVFLLRRVVPNLNYNNHEVTVAHFKQLLEKDRIFKGVVNESMGMYDEGRYEATLPGMYGPAFEDTFNQEFQNANPAVLAVLDNYYPLVSLDLGMVVKSRKETSSLLINQLELTTSTPITVQDKSTGKSKITITQTNGKKTTVLTFTFTNINNPSGEYAFDIIKNTTTNPSGEEYVAHALTYARFGPMPLILNLNGKSYAEFKRLLPNTTYFWRVRGIKEPTNPASPFTWYPWSTTNSFTTPTGVPALVSVGSPTKFQGEVYETEIAPALVSESKSTSIAVQGFKQLNWTGPTTGTTYTLTVYRTANRTGTPVLVKRGIIGKSFIVPGLIPGKTYFYDLSAKNAFGTGPRGAVYSFKAEAGVKAGTVR